MLQCFTPEEFDERLAADEIEQEGPEWVERVIAVLKLGFASQALGKVDPEIFDPLRPRREVIAAVTNPYEAKTEEPMTQHCAIPAEAVSPNQAAAMFSLFAGPSNRKS